MKVVLGFSGGLDTSYCVIYLKEQYNADVITVTLDTGGFSKDELKKIENRSKELGASKHLTVDGVNDVYNDFVSYIIKGNTLRGGKYPLCVASERVVQARTVIDIAKEVNADTVAHGCTGAGNDQIRFDVAFATLSPDLKKLSPIRDTGIQRAEEIKYLKDRGFPVEETHKKYSINESMWGRTIGGGEIHDSWQEPSEEAFKWTVSPTKALDDPSYIEIDFQEGLPTALDGIKMSGPELIFQLNTLAGKHGVGRGIHVGDTIMGIKGRIAFEAPAPLILIEAHKELEKIILSRWQLIWKKKIADCWGDFLHLGLYFDPAMRDFEAFLDSTQEFVTGTVRMKLHKGTMIAVGCKSPYSLIKKDIAVYGEKALEWSGHDAEGFAKIWAMQSKLTYLAQGEKNSE